MISSMTNKELEVLTNIIGAVESGGQVYGNRDYGAYAPPYKNSSNEHTCTLGWCQFYGNNAKKLIQNIYDTDKNAVPAVIIPKLSVDWVATRWNPSSTEKTALISAITSAAGKKCQDNMFQESAKKTISDAEAIGVTDVGAQIMYVEIAHLGGDSAAKRIFNKASKPYTVDGIFSTLMLDQKDTSNNNQVGDKVFQSRHECCVKWIKQYIVTTSDTSTSVNIPSSSDPIQDIISIASAEVGYLEKKSNSQLDSKTENAGYNNYTKYWRDVYPAYQGQAWCACFVSWCFMKAFGLETAKKLLKHWPYVYCPTMANLFTLNANPKVGDIVIFYRNGEFAHTGLVIGVNGDQFTTIEGNTSNGSTIVANGGGVCQKSYYNSNLPGTKFCTPDYSIVDKIYGSTDTTPAASAPTTPSSIPSVLRYGSTGEAVKSYQKDLMALGYDIGSAGADGDFGNKTREATLKFQNDYGLEVDGEVGPLTLAAVSKALANKTQTTTTTQERHITPYTVKIVASALNIRSGASATYPVVGVIQDRGIYTIVDEKNGWGKLKSGAGWIFLQYTDRI